jgi:pyruvate-formate lyase-activating enzyme
VIKQPASWYDRSMSGLLPTVVYADEAGNIVDFPELEMAGSSAGRLKRIRPNEWISLPPGSELFHLPGRFPVGYDPSLGSFRTLEKDPYSGNGAISAVAAFIAPAHTGLYTAAYNSTKDAAILPLFAYSSVGWYEGDFVVAAVRIDSDPRQDFNEFDAAEIERNARRRMKARKDNRLVQHLGNCALGYGCPAAKNYFLDRWEAPLPTSPVCNAHCLGCISLQKDSGVCATQDRIRFVPTAEEIAGVAVPHLKSAPRAVVSFGQGCEGEPLLQSATIGQSIRLIRSATSRGTVNMNTNASLPDQIAALRDCGLDSIRVSLNSCRPEYYHRYYDPQGYTFADVKDSIRVMKRAGGFVSLNLFVLPGFTDHPAEVDALSMLIEKTELDLIQMRNLNIDPEWYLSHIRFKGDGRALGILKAIELLRSRYPDLRFGYFNPCLDPQTG